MRATQSIALPLQECGKPKRRIRVFECPYCGCVSPMEPKARGEDFALSTCHGCFAVTANDTARNWLQDPE